MLKYIKHHMTEIDGIEIYPIISLIIFVGFFTLMGVRVWRMRSEDVQELKNYPLDQNEEA
jgi:cytochrome c oxidase cbb3-type subunit 4